MVTTIRIKTNTPTADPIPANTAWLSDDDPEVRLTTGVSHTGSGTKYPDSFTTLHAVKWKGETQTVTPSTIPQK